MAIWQPAATRDRLETDLQYHYNFPPMEQAGCWDWELKHAAGELVEACTAMTTGERILEVMDIIECCENALRDLTGNSEKALQAHYRMHHGKNEVRGYYD